MKSANLKKLPKNYILECFTKLNTRHTFCSWLIRCVNMTWIRLVLWMMHSGHYSVHRRTDGQGETTIPPPQPPPPPPTPTPTPSNSFSGEGVQKSSIKRIKHGKFGASGAALNLESQTRINPLIMDIHNWVLDDHNSIMTIHGRHS